ncbi:MAG: SH3 domain-containing protein, partial [Rhizobiaceae bacterium]
AITTSNVNFREGPGTSFRSLQILPAGARVSVEVCNDSGSWCSIIYETKSGFVSGRYLEESPGSESPGWPRAYRIGDKASLVLYEPQFTDWENYTTLKAVIAAEYRREETSNPIFGVISLSAQTNRNSVTEEVVLSDIVATKLDFSALDRKTLAELSLETGKLLPTSTITVKEERVIAGLTSFKNIADVQGLNTDPPTILHAKNNSRLLQTDGDPTFAPVKGAAGVEFIVNTNWDVFRVDNTYWLRVGGSWMRSDNLDGVWKSASQLPRALSALPDDGNWEAAREAIPGKPFEGAAPKILFSQVATELILFDGDPKLIDMPGTALQWASNTQSDVFKLRSTGEWFFLTSGRWFKSKSLNGPWTFATPNLPADFQNIPDNQPYYTVRASVPGTSEANEARLRASIPELARIEAGKIAASVAYQGEPVFSPIEDTELKYATNTSAQVIQVGNKYFVVQDGVWFVGDSPAGPWRLAREVPQEIYAIPPSSPVHNVTYVRVYKVEDDAVWCGHTAGYLLNFVAWGIVAYGTGWDYPPYWYYGAPVPVYYPRPLTYGSGAYYNPALGAYGRYGYAYGPYRGIEARAAWNPVTGTYRRGAAVHGPRGSAGFVRAWNPRTGTRAYAVGGRGVYGSWKSAGVVRGSDYIRARGVQGNAGGKALRWSGSQGEGFLAGRRGNIYAGRDGNVYRNVGNGWQKWDKDGGWNRVTAPKREQLKGSSSVRGQRGAVAAPNRTRTRNGEQLNKTARRASPARKSNRRASTSPARRQAQTQRQRPRQASPRRQVPQSVTRHHRARQISNQRSHRQRQYRQPPRRSAGRSSSRNRGGGSRGRGRRR